MFVVETYIVATVSFNSNAGFIIS